MFDHNGSMLFGGGFMWLTWIFIIVVAVWIIKIVINTDQRPGNSHQEDPVEILKIRLARGEIDENEFQRKRKELEG